MITIFFIRKNDFFYDFGRWKCYFQKLDTDKVWRIVSLEKVSYLFSFQKLVFMVITKRSVKNKIF